MTINFFLINYGLISNNNQVLVMKINEYKRAELRNGSNI